MLANGHQAQAVIEAEATADALRLKISVLETMLAESTVREIDHTTKYRLEMESLKRTQEAERTRLGSANAKLLREFAFTHPKILALTRPNFPQILFCG